MSLRTLERAALGDAFPLGSLYSGFTDTFCGVSILEGNPPPEALSIIEINNTQSEYVRAHKLSDKFTKLDISAELQLSVLCGLVRVGGSGRFLTEDEKSGSFFQASYVITIRTVKENLNLLNERLRGIIALDAFNHSQATHVVVGIEWGANVILRAQQRIENSKQRMEAEGNLEASLKKVAGGLLSATGRGGGQVKDADASNAEDISIKIAGDLLMEGQAPQTMQGAMELVSTIPGLLRIPNNGKGVPLRYFLIPLSLIRDYFHIQTMTKQVLKSLNAETLQRTVHFFDDVAEAKQQLYGFCSDVNKYERYLPQGYVDSLRNLQQGLDNAGSGIQQQLQTVLIKIRKGEAEPYELDTLRQKYEKKSYSPQKVQRELERFRAVRGKINILRRLRGLGVQLIEKNEVSVGNMLLEFSADVIYVLFHSSSLATSSEAEHTGTNTSWDEQLALFRALVGKEKAAKFLYADLDAAPDLKPEEVGCRNVIQKYDRTGKCICTDVYTTLNTKDNDDLRMLEQAGVTVIRENFMELEVILRAIRDREDKKDIFVLFYMSDAQAKVSADWKGHLEWFIRNSRESFLYRFVCIDLDAAPNLAPAGGTRRIVIQSFRSDGTIVWDKVDITTSLFLTIVK